MDITTTAWISCTRRIIFFASVPTSVNHNVSFQTGIIKKCRLATSRLKKQITQISERYSLSLPKEIFNSESKHDVLTRNPAHFLTTWSIKMKTTKKASLSLLALTSCLAFNSHSSIIINEIDYDQPGTDTAEFIELFNSGTSIMALDNYTIDLINGSSASSYRTIDLSGFNIDASGYFVMCGDASMVANCDYSFTTTNSWFQNGAPDAVGLYNNTDLLDSLSYEGTLAPFTEGSLITVSDNNTDILSIGRIISGIDSNDNALDFELGCITPGTANIAGSGDCSSSNVSTVPVPAAAWLFGSGLIGLVGMARRK
jgi:hypothetical protein